MNGKTIDHATLSHLAEAGAVAAAHVIGRPGGWSLMVNYGTNERFLAAQRSKQVRLFRRMDTLVNYLSDIGILSFDVDAAGYESGGGQTYTRPDRAEALRRTHQAAAHDKWFRQQVEVALHEADDPQTDWVNHDDARQDWAQMRATFKRRLASGGR